LRVETTLLDVASDDSVSKGIHEVLDKTGGRLDVVVNNAGYYALGPLEETTPDELRAQLETNVIGVHRVTRAVLPAMRAQGSGRIIVLGSISGRVAVPMVGPYHASKWALEGMIEAWRLELIPFGIHVSLIEPGPYDTSLYANEKLAVATAAAGEGGAYGPLMAAYRRQSARLKRERDSGPLLDVIERAATVANPKLRWMVGPTSFSGGRLRAFVPDRLYEWIMRLGFPIRRLPPPSSDGS